MAIREVRIHSLGELVEAVTPREPHPDSGRLREQAVYRGVGYGDSALLTSLDRLGLPTAQAHEKAHLEEHLFRSFLRYSRPHLPVEPANDWELLVIAQHHGLPTRLLDWSYSPLAAAHFATLGGVRREDRIIWKLDYGRMHARFRLPPLALTVQDVDRVLCDRGVASVWELFAKREGSAEPFVCLLEPPALDARIVAQSAAFTLSSDKTRPLDAILAEAGLTECLLRCVIPCGSVDRIRDQLDLCSIDERRLFPDLDGAAAQVRRYYSMTGGQAQAAGTAAPQVTGTNASNPSEPHGSAGQTIDKTYQRHPKH
jgi:hypothetical protein